MLELIPERAQRGALLRRQQPEETVGRGALGHRLAALRGLVGVPVEIPGVDLDQVVQHDHGAYLAQVGSIFSI